MTSKKPDRSHRKPISLLMLQTREIAASDFKARCLEIMDEVERTGAEVVITKHRRPVARLVRARQDVSLFCGSLKGAIAYEGDITSPVDVEWSADESNLA